MENIRLGVVVQFGGGVEEDFKKANDMGFKTCQLIGWDKRYFTDEYANIVTDASRRYDVDITAFWCGWYMPAVWNFYEDQTTLGLVPAPYRFARMQMPIKGSDFAKKIGTENLVTHAGFLPQNPNDPDYIGVVQELKFVAQHCRANGQYFLFKSGQEAPITLKEKSAARSR